MSPSGNFPHLSYHAGWEEMLRILNTNYLSRRMALCGLCMIALLFVLAGCGGSSNIATNAPASTSTGTATVGATNTTPSPTSTQPGATPTQSRPSPTPTKAKPTPITMNVTIVDNGSFAFSPQTLNISVGTTIIWKNNTTAPHTVTSDNGVFNSGAISPGGTFSFKFTQAGTFAYHCDFHPYDSVYHCKVSHLIRKRPTFCCMVWVHCP